MLGNPELEVSGQEVTTPEEEVRGQRGKGRCGAVAQLDVAQRDEAQREPTRDVVCVAP